MMCENDYGSWYRINFNCWYKNFDVVLSKNKIDEKLIKIFILKVLILVFVVIIDDFW